MGAWSRRIPFKVDVAGIIVVITVVWLLAPLLR